MNIASTNIASANTAATTPPPGTPAAGPPDLWVWPLTDLGNARRLVRAFGADVRFLAAAQAWLVWDGRRWARDDTGEVHRFARQVADRLMGAPMAGGPTLPPARVRDAQDADQAGLDDADRLELENQAEAAGRRVLKARRDFARRSQSRARLEAAVALAECEPGVPVRPADLDADPWLLCARNGTVDLTTGALRPHRRGDLITRLAPADYDRNALCPLWERTLVRVLPDPEVRAFVQRSAGYALTGSVREQCVFLWHGGGRNGKTTVVEALRHALGDYAAETPAETLTARSGGGVPSDVARLAGARFVTARETEDGQRLAEGLVKQLSGGDTVTARFLFHEWFEFTPVLKLFLATNHRPQVRGTDEGLWRRIHLVPWDQTLSPAEVDRDLPEKLKAEAAGILAWAVRGCLAWQRAGLCPPAAVADATAAYRRESDAVAGFLDERCVLRGDLSQPAGALLAAFEAWARESQSPPVSPPDFVRRLAERGLRKARRRAGYVWEGLALRDDWEGLALRDEGTTGEPS